MEHVTYPRKRIAELLSMSDAALGLYVLRPKIALGWTLQNMDEFGKTYTRWRF